MYIFSAKILSLLMFLCFFCSKTVLAEKYAFVVGIQEYENLLSQFQLKRPVQDAETIAETLFDLGYEVTLKKNLRSYEFDIAYGEFLSKIGSNDSAVIFMSGHGIEIEGTSYLLPRDIPQAKYGRQSELIRKSISLPSVLEDLREQGPKITVMIFDACRVHPLIPPTHRKRFDFQAESGIKVKNAVEGEIHLYSAGSGQEALDGLSSEDKHKNSLYVRNLVPLMLTKDLDIDELASKLQNAVSTQAASVQHRQIPAVSDQLTGKFCFLGCESEEIPDLQEKLEEVLDKTAAKHEQNIFHDKRVVGAGLSILAVLLYFLSQDDTGKSDSVTFTVSPPEL